MNRPARRAPQLMMAPLIDVVFQLLAFFLITWNYMQLPALKVNLPESMTAEVEQKEYSLVVTIHKDGSYIWENRILSDKELQSVLAERTSETPVVQKVEIIADRGAPLQALIRLLDILRSLNLTKISLATLPAEEI